MKTEKNKRLLLLGSAIWKDVLRDYAETNNIDLIFVGNKESELEEIAKETYRLDSTNPDVMIPFIKSHNIDGVFMGGSEYVISRVCDYVNELGFPCYCTKEQWDVCQNKRLFKQLCRSYGVPCVQEFSIDDDPSTFEYPIIVKPTDACAARGITVCQNVEEYKRAIEHALNYSTEKKAIIEKFIENNGTTMSVKYLAIDGELYLEAVGDRYVLEHERGRALITAAAFYPSKYLDMYINTIDEKVKTMFKGIGLKNGVLFMEAIANNNGIWFYEMGLRISGGMTYKITEKTNGINELKMLINHAATGKMCDKTDLKNIDPHFNGYISASISIPLSIGTIKSIKGFDVINAIPEIGNIVKYWKEGETILPQHISTLDQLFARIPIIVKGKERLSEIIDTIRANVSIKDTLGCEMVIWSKLEEIFNNYSR